MIVGLESVKVSKDKKMRRYNSGLIRGQKVLTVYLGKRGNHLSLIK